MADTRLLWELKAVAVLFIVGGVFSVLDIVVSLFHNTLKFNTGVLGLFVGFGLLRLSRGWRTCGLVLIWLGFAFATIAAALMIMDPGPFRVSFLGLPLGKAPPAVAWVFLIVSFLLTLWQYYVLTRADVRTLFGVRP